MAEEIKDVYKVKSRSEMKTINVVFVSDELVGETIVSRKEYERAMRQKVKTESEKPKAEEAEVVIPSKSRKRKASEGVEEDVKAKKPKLVDDVELALAALEHEGEDGDDEDDEEDEENKGKESGRREGSRLKRKAKESTGKDYIEKMDTGNEGKDKKESKKKEKGKKEPKKTDKGKKEPKKKDSDKKDKGKKDPGRKSAGKDGTEKNDAGKEHRGKSDAGKEQKGKSDAGKEQKGKNEAGKEHADKSDAGKKDSSKESAGKEDAGKEDVGKEDVGKGCAEHLKLIMGDEKGASPSADSKTEILNLQSFIKGQGASGMEEKEGETSQAKPDKGKPAKQKVITPYSLRKRVIRDIKKIQRILENSDDEGNEISSSESEFLDSSEDTESDDNNDASEKVPIPSSSTCINYFEAQSFRRNITSNNTLKSLKNPPMNHKELNKIVRKFKLTPGHRNAIKSLINESVMLFSKWDFLLKNNFNLLLHGVGSKREIVNNFVERYAKKYPLIVVNGFFPDVSVREVTEKICQVLEIGPAKTDVTAEINRRLNEYHVEIYIVINNIDGLMLRNKRTQIILSQYAKMEGIHMIATIDHINAPLMWDQSTYSDFSWIWYDCTTFLNYTDEVVYEGNIMLQNSGQLTLSSLRNVYNSLTKNSRSIFLLIAKEELNNPSNMRRGVSFKELYQACRKELLISSDVALRTLLKEFIDHAILKQKRTTDGEEVFVVTVENNILKQFVEDQERR